MLNIYVCDALVLFANMLGEVFASSPHSIDLDYVPHNFANGSQVNWVLFMLVSNSVAFEWSMHLPLCSGDKFVDQNSKQFGRAMGSLVVCIALFDQALLCDNYKGGKFLDLPQLASNRGRIVQQVAMTFCCSAIAMPSLAVSALLVAYTP